MFQRKSSASLPTTMSPMTLPTGNDYSKDGSGKAIKMDAPVVKAWKQASTSTKYSYYILGFCLFMVFMGFRHLRYWNASIWLTCHAQECTLEVTPPGFRTHTVVFSRTQLVGSQATKVDKLGNFVSVDDSKFDPPPRSKSKKKSYQSGAYKGADENGNYRSFSIRFHPQTPAKVEKSEEDIDDGDFSELVKFMDKESSAEFGELYVLHMRKFGLTQSRTRVRSSVNKVESYIKRRRQKLVVKESGPLPWQGLLLLIFGIMGAMLALLLGQFWEETPKKQGGPGTRRPPSSSAKAGKATPTFVVDTGRPSKFPPGYQYQKKY